MSPTLSAQTRPKDPSKYAAAVGWDRWDGDVQSAAESPDRELLRTVSNALTDDPAFTESLSELDSHTTLVHEHMAALLEPWSKVGSATRWEEPRVTRPSSVAGAEGRPTARKVLELRLTKRQVQQVTRARLRSGNSAARRAAYDQFQLLRQWDGEVTQVEADKFAGSVVSLDSRTNRTRRERMAFPLHLVREQDRVLVVEGAAFFYCVGRFVTAGQLTPGSLIWFRRFRENPASTESVIQAAKAASRIEWAS